MNRKFIYFFSILFSCFAAGESVANRVIQVVQKCSVCGHAQQTSQYMSYNSLGSKQYLDLRVHGGMMPTHFIKVCNECGLVSYNIEKPICDSQSEIVNSKEYQDIIGDVYSYSDAYMAHAMLLQKCGSGNQEIAKSILLAAWSADDKKNYDKAKEYRKKAIKYYEPSQLLQDKFVLLDLYRRTENFDLAQSLIKKLEKEDLNCLYKQIILQQKELLQNKNTDNHQIDKENCIK